MPVQGFINTSLQEAGSRRTEESRDVPDGHTFRELSARIPTSKEEYDDWRKG